MVGVKEQVLGFLEKEPHTVSELKQKIPVSWPTIKKAIVELGGKVGSSGNERYIWYFLAGKDYGKYNPIAKGVAITSYAKSLLEELDNGPVWLPALDGQRECFRQDCLAMIGAGMLERHDLTVGMIYAYPNLDVEFFEKKLLEIECLKKPSYKVVLDLAEKGPFTPEDLMDIGVSQTQARRVADEFCGRGMLEQHKVKKFRIYGKPGTPERDFVLASVARHYSLGRKVIDLAKKGPFISTQVHEFLPEGLGARERKERTLSMLNRFVGRYGVLDHILVHGHGTPVGVFFLPGESEERIDEFLGKIGATRISTREKVEVMVRKKKPFTALDVCLETGVAHRTAHYHITQLLEEGAIAARMSPFEYYLYVPRGTPESAVESYRNGLDEKQRDTVLSLAKKRISTLLGRGEPFTRSEIMDGISHSYRTGTAVDELVSGIEALNVFTEPVYAAKGADWNKVSKKARELGLKLTDEWNVKGQYAFVTGNRNEIAANASVSREQADSFLGDLPEDDRLILVNVTGIPFIEQDLRERLKYREVAISKVRDAAAQKPRDYLVVASSKPDIDCGYIRSSGGLKPLTQHSRGIFAGKPFSEIAVDKLPIAAACIDTLSKLDGKYGH